MPKKTEYQLHHMVAVIENFYAPPYAGIVCLVEDTSAKHHARKYSAEGNIYAVFEVDNTGVIAYRENIHELRIDGFYYGYPLPKDEG